MSITTQSWSARPCSSRVWHLRPLYGFFVQFWPPWKSSHRTLIKAQIRDLLPWPWREFRTTYVKLYLYSEALDKPGDIILNDTESKLSKERGFFVALPACLLAWASVAGQILGDENIACLPADDASLIMQKNGPLANGKSLQWRFAEAVANGHAGRHGRTSLHDILLPPASALYMQWHWEPDKWEQFSFATAPWFWLWQSCWPQKSACPHSYPVPKHSQGRWKHEASLTETFIRKTCLFTQNYLKIIVFLPAVIWHLLQFLIDIWEIVWRDYERWFDALAFLQLFWLALFYMLSSASCGGGGGGAFSILVKAPLAARRLLATNLVLMSGILNTAQTNV